MFLPREDNCALVERRNQLAVCDCAGSKTLKPSLDEDRVT